MTLTMDSLCPHISQSKTRVLKSDMKTSYGITFQELKNRPKTYKIYYYWVLFWWTPLWITKTPSETSKSRPGGSQSPPRGSLDPPGATKNGPKTAQMAIARFGGRPPGAQGAQTDAPDTSRGRLGDILGPPGLHFEVHLDTKTCLRTPKREVKERARRGERKQGEEKRREEKRREEKRGEERRGEKRREQKKGRGKQDKKRRRERRDGHQETGRGGIPTWLVPP